MYHGEQPLQEPGSDSLERKEKICKEYHHTKGRKLEHRVYFLVLAWPSIMNEGLNMDAYFSVWEQSAVLEVFLRAAGEFKLYLAP